MTKTLQKKNPLLNDDIGLTTGKCNIGALLTYAGTFIIFTASIILTVGGI